MSLDFSGGFSSAVAGAGNTLTTLLNYLYSKKMMDRQYKYQIKGLQESPSALRVGLERAGYNPITYANQTNAMASVGSAPGISQGTLGTDMVNAYQQNKLNKAQIDNTNASTNNINADTENKKVQNGILLADKKIREYETDMKKFDKDTQAYTWAMNMKEMWSKTKLNLETARLADYNAVSQRIASNAQKLQSETSAKWTPGKIGASVGLGAVGALGALYGPAKFKVLKALGKAGRKVGF